MIFFFPFQDNTISIKDTPRKFTGGQTISPRYTIDAILGLNPHTNSNNGGKLYFKFKV